MGVLGLHGEVRLNIVRLLVIADVVGQAAPAPRLHFGNGPAVFGHELAHPLRYLGDILVSYLRTHEKNQFVNVHVCTLYLIPNMAAGP